MIKKTLAVVAGKCLLLFLPQKLLSHFSEELWLEFIVPQLGWVGAVLFWVGWFFFPSFGAFAGVVVQEHPKYL